MKPIEEIRLEVAIKVFTQITTYTTEDPKVCAFLSFTCADAFIQEYVQRYPEARVE